MTQAETDARRGSEAGEEPYVLDDQIGYLLRLANQRRVAGWGQCPTSPQLSAR